MGTTDKTGYFEKLRSLSRMQKIVFWSLIAVIFYTLAGFLAAPPLLKLVLEKKIPEILQRPTSIQKIKLNPFTLTTTVENFALQQKDNSTNFIAFDHLFVNLQISSIFKRALVIKDLQLTGPEINFVRLNEDLYSFSDLLTDTEKESPTKQSGKPFLFSINNIEIAGGSIEFQDRPKDKTHLLSALNLAIPTISNLPIDIDTHVQPAFSAKINGTELALSGKTKPFAHSQETIFDLKLSKLNIPEYLAYIPNPTEATLKSATLDIDTQLSYVDTPDERRLSLSGLLSLSDLNLVDLQGTSYARFPKIDIQIAASNLLRQNIVLESINLISPELDFTRQTDGEMLPLSLLTPSKETPPSQDEGKEKKGETRPMTVSIHTVTIADGVISFLDQSADNFETTLTPLDLKITNFSTKPQTMADFLVQTRSESDELFTLQGQAGIDPLIADGNLNLQGLNLIKYNPYLTDLLNPEISGGKIDFASHFQFSKDEHESKTRLDNVAIQLSDFSLSDGPENLIHIPLLAISETIIDLNKQELTIGALNSKSAEFLLKKGKEGEINLAKLPKETEQETTAEDVDPEKADVAEQKSWIVTLNNATIEKYGITFIDQGPDSPFTAQITDMSLNLGAISTAQNSTGNISFSFRLNDSGKLAGEGILGLSPFSTILTLEGNNIALPPLQNYAADRAHILITDGAVSTNGELNITQKDEISAHFKGRTQVSDLAIADIDGEDLLRWKELSINGIQFSNQPQNVAIEEVAWKELFLQLTILEDGSLNLANVLPDTPAKATQEEEHPEPVPAAAKEETQEAKEINIDTFILSGAKIHFLDQKISPSYTATLDNFGGTITGLSTNKESLAQVELKGNINQHAPMTMTGAINPLKEELFADLKLDFHDIDLSPTSPYTGKFIGYKTDKGKLSLDLHYSINGKELKAKNQLFLDQFTLGDFVESPDAASLPIHLAIALLKNRSGEIFLNIPVEGNMDDPEFSLASVIFRVIFNLIAKAATSPFALLGALIPDGEDMQYVQFQPGTAEITPKAADKLTKMATVLFERPGLRMDIQGRAAEVDRTSLAQSRLEQLIKLQKLQETGSTAKNNEADAPIFISEEEYPLYLSKAYEVHKNQVPSKDTPEKSKDETKVVQVAPAASLTEEEMKKEMLAAIIIKDDKLRLLALQRSNYVMDFLVKTGPVEVERLFIVEPQTVAKDSEDKKAPPQVDLIIK